VIARLGGPGAPRWRNLHRRTDPIGGPIAGLDGQDPLPDPCGRGHADYWLEPQYAEAVALLRRQLAEPAAAEPGRDADVTTATIA
jgi:hypothetical protein